MKLLLLGLILATKFILLPIVSHAYAEDVDPERILENKFWGDLYSSGGETFYCSKPFANKTPLISESYVYATSDIREHLQCGTNRQCKRESEEYKKMLSDLNNIVPADSYFEFKRKSAHFGFLDKSVKANECGIRKKFQVIEPKDSIKGDIARIILYMHTAYDLPLKMTLADIKLWNQLDPPDKEEVERNSKIFKLQGKSNQYVESPQLIDEHQASDH